MRSRSLVLRRTAIVFTSSAVIAVTQTAHAFTPVVGGPSYDQPTITGYTNSGQQVPTVSAVNNAGTAIGNAHLSISGMSKGYRAVRWDSLGNVLEAQVLTTTSTDMSNAGCYAINDSNMIAGYVQQYDGDTPTGFWPTRWDASGNAQLLDNLGTSTAGYTYGLAVAINSTGTAAGQLFKYDSGTMLGHRPVRWNLAGDVEEMEPLGTLSSGHGNATARAINDAGLAVGYSDKIVSDVSLGNRAVRWDTLGNAQELGHLGLNGAGTTNGGATAINAAGIATGYMYRYDSGVYKGNRAVKWDLAGNATELDYLVADPSGIAGTYPNAINNSEIIVGAGDVYAGSTYLGSRAIRWDAMGNAQELGNLGTDGTGLTYCDALDVNSDGIAVGSAAIFASGSYAGTRAVYWQLDGSVVNLNDLIDPASGWTLTDSRSISDTYWISGVGTYDPDGPGGYSAYQRLFTMQIPEPTALLLLPCVAAALARRRAR